MPAYEDLFNVLMTYVGDGPRAVYVTDTCRLVVSNSDNYCDATLVFERKSRDSMGVEMWDRKESRLLPPRGATDSDGYTILLWLSACIQGTGHSDLAIESIRTCLPFVVSVHPTSNDIPERYVCVAGTKRTEFHVIHEYALTDALGSTGWVKAGTDYYDTRSLDINGYAALWRIAQQVQNES
jgi:hypothetical protein